MRKMEEWLRIQCRPVNTNRFHFGECPRRRPVGMSQRAGRGKCEPAPWWWIVGLDASLYQLQRQNCGAFYELCLLDLRLFLACCCVIWLEFADIPLD
jgi:hypothetical protein